MSPKAQDGHTLLAYLVGASVALLIGVVLAVVIDVSPLVGLMPAALFLGIGWQKNRAH